MFNYPHESCYENHLICSLSFLKVPITQFKMIRVAHINFLLESLDLGLNTILQEIQEVGKFVIHHQPFMLYTRIQSATSSMWKVQDKWPGFSNKYVQ